MSETTRARQIVVHDIGNIRIIRIRTALFALVAMAVLGRVGAIARDASSSSPAMQSQRATPDRSISEDSYRLGTGDKIRLTVFGQEDLKGEFVIDDTGIVRLPMIGAVKAAGSVVREFEEAITTKLKDGYLLNPRVSVEVINYRPFYIMGEVNKPGEYPYETGMSVLNAVSLAGGFTYRADEAEVFVRHKDKSGEEKEPADTTTTVQPGDIIRVAERFF